MSKLKQKGFTLIELLVVIAIIGLLASIVLVSLSNARIKGRDAKRKADLEEINTAMELYFNTYSTYLVTDPSTGIATGWTGCGCGWFSYSDGGSYREAVGQGLVGAGMIGSNPHDPGGADTGSAAGKTGYMLYRCSTTGYYVFAGLESPGPTDGAGYQTAVACIGSLNSYGMNYAVGHN